MGDQRTVPVGETYYYKYKHNLCDVADKMLGTTNTLLCVIYWSIVLFAATWHLLLDFFHSENQEDAWTGSGT